MGPQFTGLSWGPVMSLLCQTTNFHLGRHWMLMCSMFVCRTNKEKYKHLHATVWIITHTFINDYTRRTVADSWWRKWFWWFDLTLDTVGGEEGNVAGFQWVVMGTVRWPGLGLWFSSQGWVVHLYKEGENIWSVCVRERQRQKEKAKGVSHWLSVFSMCLFCFVFVNDWCASKDCLCCCAEFSCVLMHKLHFINTCMAFWDWTEVQMLTCRTT